MNEKFTVELCSDLDYEEMVADISYENCAVAIVTQEEGVDNMKIEILASQNEALILPLDDFINAIALAKKSLVNFR